ncbi:MAG: hypothetical protein ACXWGW_08060 [Methylobacter sp.]
MSSEAEISNRPLDSKTRTEQQAPSNDSMANIRQIQSLIESGIFDQSCSERCLKRNATASIKALILDVFTEIPELERPLQAELLNESEFYVQCGPFAPDSFMELD